MRERMRVILRGEDDGKGEWCESESDGEVEKCKINRILYLIWSRWIREGDVNEFHVAANSRQRGPALEGI